MMQSPLYETYAQVAPRVQDWPLLISRLEELLARDYDWSAGLTAITAPVMLVFADADSIFPAQMVEFFALLGGGLRDTGWDGASRPRGQLAIRPGRRTTTFLPGPPWRKRSSPSLMPPSASPFPESCGRPFTISC